MLGTEEPSTPAGIRRSPVPAGGGGRPGGHGEAGRGVELVSSGAEAGTDTCDTPAGAAGGNSSA